MNWKSISGNVMGGVTAAVLSVPVCVGFGMLALAPLGSEFVQHGVLAGLYAAVCGGLIAAATGGRKSTIIYSPRGIVTFLISALVAQNLVTAAHNEAGIHDHEMLIGLVFLLVFLSGALQTLYGILKFGVFAKYLPAPVLAGFQVAGSVLIFAAQIPILLGLPTGTSLLALPEQMDQIQPYTLGVGLLTCGAILLIPRISRAAPSNIGGIIVGAAGFYALTALGLHEKLGPLIGNIDWSMPTPHYFGKFVDLILLPQYQMLLLPVLSGAASLSVISALDTLLGARLAERRLSQPREGNRELYIQGLASMLSAGFGGISTGINMAASHANQRSGGSGFVSVLVYVSVILSGFLLPLIGLIPRVVIAGMLIAAAIQLFDRWTLDMLRKIARGRAANRDGVIADLSIVAIVAIMAIVANIGLAVLMGFVVTIAIFLFRISKSVIRREYRGNAIHSRKTRDSGQTAALAQHGGQIAVLEVEGPVFFGTSDTLDARLNALASSDATYVILDVKRVNEMDSSGARVILQGHDRLIRNGKQLLLGGADDRVEVSGMLRDTGVTAALGAGHIFADADAALEWAEDRVLLTRRNNSALAGEFPLARFDVMEGIDDVERPIVESALVRREWQRGGIVFNEGDAGDELFLLAKGSASVRMHMPGENRSMRLVTFSPGTLFGELALLDREARSATVEADDDLICYVLSRERFMRLSTEHPTLAIKLMTNLGREISGRLRRANRTIYQLES